MTHCQQYHSLPDIEPRISSSAPQLQLEEVEKETLGVDVQNLGSLFEKRRVLKQQVNIQSPLLQLPNEILREIAMAAFPQGIHVDLWEKTTPLLLGSICRTWRHTIWSMPQIWSTIRVEVRTRYRASKILLLEEWLLRSQKLPISVHLKLAEPHDDNDAGMMWKALDLIARKSEKWQEVYFDIPDFFNRANCYIPRSFPHLRSLSLLTDAELYHFKIFQSAPILSEVSLKISDFDSIVLPAIPLSRLTLRYAWGSAVLKLLRRHPNLVHASFTRVSDSRSGYRKAEATSLKTLNISFDWNLDAVAPLFNNLFTPCLRDLCIDMKSCPPFSHTILIPILSRSSFTLVRLCLFRAHVSDEGLVECLKVIPNIQELKLGEIPIGTYLISNLTVREEEESSILLPQLHSLFLILNELLFDFVDLAKMIQTRRSETMDVQERRVAQMESLTVHLADIGKGSKGLPTLATLGYFQDLEKEGVKIELKTPN